VVGSVFTELSWRSMQTRLVTAAVASLVVLILATILMGYLSHRLYRNITEPIAELATAARRVGQDEDPRLPVIDVGRQDEVGDLVKAFRSMAERVRAANHSLSDANESLRLEIEERRAGAVEREALLERERQANRVKDEFLAVVSHELRTPLNAIVGWARILVSTDPDKATINKAASSLHRNALAQARVIDDLIDISRIVTGKLAVRSEPVDLRGVVESAVEAMRPTAHRAGVTFTVRIPSVPCIVIGDRDRLSQVVVNLLSNAVKFAPRSIVKVAMVPEGSLLQLSVSDTGVGISPEFLTHVFDRFRQADASSTRDHGGLGIGLTIAKELVELHGGSIRAESQGRGLGATFTIALPWSAHQTVIDQADDAPPLLTDVSVLAVDDNADALELLEAALSQAGATVRVASSGAEAVELWQAAPFDVLLCDLAMPRMSGYELLAVIRELDRKKGRLTPAIAVTAHATEEQVARSAQAGFQVHVAKPFDANRLIRAVSLARNKI
jgi:signal transduction histidine kinase/ActR/RegA family two-component response regulator